MRRVVTVFGSSRPRPGEMEYDEARQLGTALASAGFVVCNGGYGGIMEATARGAREAGGHTIGVTVNAFGAREANRWIVEVDERPTLFDRLNRLVELGDAYVILKGGTGTLLELAAVWEMMNKGLMPERPAIALGDFWNGVIATLRDELAWEGKEHCTRYVRIAPDVESCITILTQHLGSPHGR
ncbi:MAG: LOG family protein [Bacteroidota bacterium]